MQLFKKKTLRKPLSVIKMLCVFGIGWIPSETIIERNRTMCFSFYFPSLCFCLAAKYIQLYFKRWSLWLSLNFCPLQLEILHVSAKEQNKQVNYQRFMLTAASRLWHTTFQCSSISDTFYSCETRRMMVDAQREYFIHMELN